MLSKTASYIKPIIEYTVIILSPYTQDDVNLVEIEVPPPGSYILTYMEELTHVNLRTIRLWNYPIIQADTLDSQLYHIANIYQYHVYLIIQSY